MDKICEKMGYKFAQKIDDKMSLVIKPRPKWCPMFLYKKIIRDSVEIITIK